MAYSATISGFTTVSGSPSNMVDGNSGTWWQPNDDYTDDTNYNITIDTGGWFLGSTFAKLRLLLSSALFPHGNFGTQLSADGTNWYNMPDNTSSFTLGVQAAADTTIAVTPMSNTFYYRYVRFLGTGGGVYHPIPSPTGLLIEEIGLLTSAGAALTVDTSGGANPNPPTGTPDTSAIPPAGSITEARTSGVGLEVMDAYLSTARVSAVGMEVMDAYLSDARVSAVGIEVMRSISSVVNPHGRGIIVG